MLPALCVRNPLVTGGFPSQGSVTWSSDVLFGLSLDIRLSKQSRCWWFDETSSSSLWRHCNYTVVIRRNLNRFWIMTITTAANWTKLQLTQKVTQLQRYSPSVPQQSIILNGWNDFIILNDKITLDAHHGVLSSVFFLFVNKCKLSFVLILCGERDRFTQCVDLW